MRYEYLTKGELLSCRKELLRLLRVCAYPEMAIEYTNRISEINELLKTL